MKSKTQKHIKHETNTWQNTNLWEVLWVRPNGAPGTVVLVYNEDSSQCTFPGCF